MLELYAGMTIAEVCALARCTPATLWGRIDAGRMPKPIGYGAQGEMFNRTSILIALGKFDHEAMPDQVAWDFDPSAFDPAPPRRPARSDHHERLTIQAAMSQRAPLDGPLFILDARPQAATTRGYARSSQP